MRLPVRTALQAEEDLIEIWSFIAKESSAAADRTLDRIRDRWDILLDYPRAGPERNDIGVGVRQLVAGNFLILYRVEQNAVMILRVLHGRRHVTSEDVH